MSSNPMVAELNRLIADKLAAGESLYLPEVGTLMVKRVAARRLSRTEVVPPQRVVEFQHTPEGANLVELLTEAAATTPESAAEIYQRWLSHTLAEGVLTIEGVGVLRHKSFTPDKEFDARLNPQGKHPVVMPRRRHRSKDWTLIFGIAAVVMALGIGLYAYFVLYKDKPSTAPTVAALPMPEKQQPDTMALATTHTAKTEPAPVAPKAPETFERLTSGHYYVVLGVYSTPENAIRAAREAMEQEPKMQPSLYYFGQKYLVAAFTSADQAECESVRRANAEKFPSLWLYRAR